MSENTTDPLKCNYNLCDEKNPCPIGCTCVYPPGATVGYCRPPTDKDQSAQTESFLRITMAGGCSQLCQQAHRDRVNNCRDLEDDPEAHKACLRDSLEELHNCVERCGGWDR